ncbi:MAG: di-trans,poly-cis-decaprenylcistransferase [Candidatus Coatesbacteria bacterium]|nr:di-trans,poly-cis-decaprenylcistransferase [Candidatus Coatesbacteria bacterium]
MDIKTASLSELPSREKRPRHIAIIMDGNGRWAKKQGLARTEGHRAGVKSVRDVIEAGVEINLSHLTLYSFSSENWKRPKIEVSFLMDLLHTYLKDEIQEMNENNIKFNAIGRIENLPFIVRNQLRKTIEATLSNTGLKLTLALSYGGRLEIVDAINKIRKSDINREITEKDLPDYLYDPSIPDVDLLIRTGSEYRISNFLLWQSAYAELFFSPLLWPEFRRPHLYAAIVDFSNRERRFGDIAPKV